MLNREVEILNYDVRVFEKERQCALLNLGRFGEAHVKQTLEQVSMSVRYVEHNSELKGAKAHSPSSSNVFALKSGEFGSCC